MGNLGMVIAMSALLARTSRARSDDLPQSTAETKPAPADTRTERQRWNDEVDARKAAKGKAVK